VIYVSAEQVFPGKYFQQVKIRKFRADDFQFFNQGTFYLLMPLWPKPFQKLFFFLVGKKNPGKDSFFSRNIFECMAEAKITISHFTHLFSVTRPHLRIFAEVIFQKTM